MIDGLEKQEVGGVTLLLANVLLAWDRGAVDVSKSISMTWRLFAFVFFFFLLFFFPFILGGFTGVMSPFRIITQMKRVISKSQLLF